MGELFRRLWHPVLLTEELPEPDGTPVRLPVLTEDLVAFRDTQGKVWGVGPAYRGNRGVRPPFQLYVTATTPDSSVASSSE